MADNPAPLLPDAAVQQARRLAPAIRNGQVAPLVGAGLSIQCGLPGWGTLIDQLILAWKQWDPSSAAHLLLDDDYVRLMRRTFKDDLALAGYLRRRIDEEHRLNPTVELQSFGELLYAALYPTLPETGPVFVPQPSHVHRHLVALVGASAYPRRIWTTNYDDLLEEAARQAGIAVRTLDPSHRTANADLSVAHLHGFLAPPEVDRRGDTDPRYAEVILSEDEFHASTSDVIGWTNRELHRLFDEHRVLILGMSLDDPNVRRVLAITARNGLPGPPRHVALLQPLTLDAADFPGVAATALATCTTDVNAARTWDWAQHDVDVVTLPDHDSVLPFLVRLRYESFGERSGDLWRRGAELGYEEVRPWRSECQELAREYLAAAVNQLQVGFGVVDPAEIAEIGIFLLRPDASTLELTFRSRIDRPHGPGRRLFSADPDRPTGVAGRVFVSGDLVRLSRNDPLHDYGISADERQASDVYAGIVSVPIVDWASDGVLLGVIYVTTTRADGGLFGLPRTRTGGPDERSLDDLYAWLAECALALLASCRALN